MAEPRAALVGFLALMAPDVLGHLYLAAPHTDRGLGEPVRRARARSASPAGCSCGPSRATPDALRFYERHGFVPVEWTDGDNEEGEPDVRMVWRP